MEIKHTKGQWKYSYGVRNTIDVYSQFSLKEYKNICELPISETKNGKAVNPKLTNEAEANAKLIAAAPELLRDLIHACALLKNTSPCNVKLFEETISKATE